MGKAILLAVLMSAMGGVVAAQDPPYFGTWKLDSSSSQMAAFSVTLRDLGDGRVEFSGGGQDDKFIIGRDGKDYPWIGGMTISWQEAGNGRVEQLVRRDGKVISTMIFTLSPDGKTLTQVSKSALPNGEAVEATNTYVRTAPGTTRTCDLLVRSGKKGAHGAAGNRCPSLFLVFLPLGATPEHGEPRPIVSHLSVSAGLAHFVVQFVVHGEVIFGVGSRAATKPQTRDDAC